MSSVLFITPPMTQVNCPYPATTVLKGFLDQQGYSSAQWDAGLDLVLSLFSKKGLAAAFKKAPLKKKSKYLSTVEGVVRFLQRPTEVEAEKILSDGFLPEGPRFNPLKIYEPLWSQFADLTTLEKAQHLASLYLDDLADFYKNAIDDRFEFSRYGEKLAASQPSFNPLLKEINRSATLVTQELEKLTRKKLKETRPDFVALSVPFSGNVFGAFLIAKTIKKISPKTQILMGGGYPSTELRSLSDPRVFKWIDYIVLDSGEEPLLRILKGEPLIRTFTCVKKKVVYHPDDGKSFAFKSLPDPTYEGLTPGKYIGMMETLNPVTRLWSQKFWNKLILAHGCYWKKCTFCDVSLSYIGRYEPLEATRIVDRMERLAAQTGEKGFHFVDEAAPPALLKAVARELIQRKLQFTWWGNIRFDKVFDEETCRLLAQSGCIAVTGGLEVASERLLKLINKGVTLPQVARVTHAFRQAGILVHAYLMYGFPSQTLQETVDSLEVTRQLFAEGCLQSAFWHRFSATVHAPVTQDPKKFGIRVLKARVPKEGLFSENDVAFKDSVKCDHDRLGLGLKRALYNYMHGNGLENDVTDWFMEFNRRPPRTQVPEEFIRSCL